MNSYVLVRLEPELPVHLEGSPHWNEWFGPTGLRSAGDDYLSPIHGCIPTTATDQVCSGFLALPGISTII